MNKQNHCINIITDKRENVNRCNECGQIIRDLEAAEHYERHGLPEPPYEVVFICPYCGGDLSPVKKCIICGEYVTEEESIGDICNSCCNKHIENFSFKNGEAYIKDTEQELEFYSAALKLSIDPEPTALEVIKDLLTDFLKKLFYMQTNHITPGRADKERGCIFADFIFPDQKTEYFEWLSGEIEKELGKGDRKGIPTAPGGQ